MSLQHSPKIITDGLVLCLDAGSRKSYPGSGTVWTDLAGSNNGTLTNGPTFSSANGGSIVFDGSNDYILGPTNSFFQFGTSDFTVDSWIYINSLPISTGYVIYDNLNLGGSGARSNAFVLLITTAGKLDVFSQGSFRGASTRALSPNIWYNVILTRTSNIWNYYINGIIDSTSYTLTTNITTGGCVIGRVADASSYYMNGRMSNFKIYKNKSLSITEIQQNYNATKGRFNL